MEEARDYYTYKLSYPASMGGALFYVGMGSGNRIDRHESDARSGVASEKCNIIRAIWEQGEEIVKSKVDEGLTWSEGLAAETKLIRECGLENLANRTASGRGPTTGNQNAARHNNPRYGKRGAHANMSMPHEEWVVFKAVCEDREGRSLTDKECIEIWRDTNRLARKAFIERHHHLGESAILHRRRSK